MPIWQSLRRVVLNKAQWLFPLRLPKPRYLRRGDWTPILEQLEDRTLLTGQLRFASVPLSTISAGQDFSVVFEAENSLGNVITSFSGNVSLTIQKDVNRAVLVGDTQVTAVGGIATFAGLSIDKSGSYVISATAGGLSPAVSNDFSVASDSATHLVVTMEPANVIAGVGFSTVITAEDDYGNPDPSFASTVNLAMSDNPVGDTLGGTTQVAATGGVATFTGLTLEKASKADSLIAVASGVRGAISSSVAVNPAAPAQLVVERQPPASVTAGAAFAVSYAVVDGFGNVVPTATGVASFEVPDDQAEISVRLINGVATLSGVKINQAGTGNQFGASFGTFSAQSNPFAVLPAGRATHLVVTTQPPASVTSNLGFAVIVRAEDDFGHVDPTFTAQVALTLANNPVGGTLSGSSQATAVAGVANFTGVLLDKAGNGYTISATATGVASAATTAFSVHAGGPTRLLLETQPPSSVTVGAAFRIAVVAADPSGNPVASFGGPVTLTLSSNPGGSTLGGTLRVTAVNGIATFSGLTLNQVGVGYTLTATAPGFTPATASTLSVTAGNSATHLVITAQPPSTVTAGGAFTVIVKAEDDFGHVDPSYTGQIGLAPGSNPGGGTLSGATPVAATGGIVMFNGLWLDKAGNGYTIRASASGLPSATTSAFKVTPGSANQLVLSVQPPATVNAGAGFGEAVAAEDAFGNPVPTFAGAVAVALGSNPASVALGGAKTVQAVSGIAKFSGLSIAKAASPYSLVASVSGLLPITSAGFTVAPAAATRLVVTSQPPSNANVGQQFNVVVVAEDNFGNVVTSFNSSVKLAIHNAPYLAALNGAAQVTAIAGVATFDAVSLNEANAGFTLIATAPGVTAAISSSVAVTVSTPFVDAFDQAANTPLTSNWQVISGQFSVREGAAWPESQGSSLAVVAGLNQSDAVISGNIAYPDSGSGRFSFYVARYIPETGNTYFGGVENSSGSIDAIIGRSVDGVSTTLAYEVLYVTQGQNAVLPPLSGPLQFEANGDQLSLTIPNFPQLNVQDSTISGPGEFGLWSSQYLFFGPVQIHHADRPPTIGVPSSPVTTLSGTVVFSPSIGTGITISDPNSPTETVTLSVDVGTVSLSGPAGLTFTQGSGANDTAMTFSGSLAAVNAALDGMTWQLPNGYLPTANMNLSVTNVDTSGLNNPQTASQTISALTDWAVSVPDPALAQAIRQSVGLSSSQPIMRSDVLKLTSLSLDSNTVRDLTGLQTAANLQSLSVLPTDWSAAGSITDLSPLAALTGLQSLALVDVGITNSELAALSTLTGLYSLDLRSNPISDISAFASLPSLTSLQVLGDPVSNFTPLAGRPVQIDVVPDTNPGEAQTVAELAAALHDSPLEMFQYVLNNVQNQLYVGLLKGAQATLETLAGDDWDQDNLLAQLLQQAGVATQFATGVIQAPVPVIENWLGATNQDGADEILDTVGLSPTYVWVGPAGNQTLDIQFNHTWLEARLTVAGQGLQWIGLDPTWKFKDYQPGVSNLLQEVPFDSSDYLSEVRQETAVEYYEAQVSQYLAANDPGVSLADAAHDGPIEQQSFAVLPPSLPFTVVGAPQIVTAVPDDNQWSVNITLSDGSTQLFTQTFILSQMSLERLTIEYTAESGGELTPELMLDGQVVAQGPPVTDGSDVTLTLNQHEPLPNGLPQTFTYDRTAGQFIAIGLNALQVSNQLLQQQEAAINTAAVAIRDGGTANPDQQIGALLALAMYQWFAQTDQAQAVFDDLTGAVPIYAGNFATGIATSDSTVTYDWDLQIPAVPNAAYVDIPNYYHHEIACNGNNSLDTQRFNLLGYNGSSEESAVWEELLNTPSMSTIKSFQLATTQAIPIVTITQATEATLLPELQLTADITNAITTELAGGATVTVPTKITPLQNWSGVGYLAIETDGLQKYMISGSLSSASATASEGGYATNPPAAVSPVSYETPDTQQLASDPVDIANGDAIQSETDLTLPGIGLSITFARKYNSQSTLDNGMGVGWSYSYGDYLTFNQDGSISWTNDQGTVNTFSPNGDGGYTLPNTLFGSFTTSATAYTFTDSHGLSYVFNLSGQLVAIRDRNGNEIDITYDANNHIAAVTEADDPATQLLFTWTGNHITAVADNTGRTWTYSYTGDELTQADAPTDAQTPEATIQYAYYSDVAFNSLLQQVTEPNGGVDTFTYYPNGRVFQVTDAMGNVGTFSYNLYRNQTSFTDANHNTTIYTYNSVGNLVAQTNPDGSQQSSVWQNNLVMSATDVFGQTNSYQYDANGNLTKTTDAAANVTTYTYTPIYNLIASVTQPNGATTTYAYDTHGNELSMTDAVGDVTTMTYDTHGQMRTKTTPRGNASQTPAAYTTTYVYTALGEVLSETTGLPSTVSFTYDPAGRMISSTDADGNQTTFRYDLLDRLISTTDALNGTSTTVYDVMGDVTSSTNALGHTTHYVFNLDQQLVQTIDPAGDISMYRYDPDGNRVSQTDALDRQTVFVYDDRNREILTIYADGSSTESLYDAGNRLVASTDADGNVTRYAYDALGRLITTTNAQGGVTKRTYDTVGNLLTVTDPMGRLTKYQCDLLNHPTAVTDPLGNTTKTSYDADGNLISTTDPLNHATTYAYDVLDRLISTTNALGGLTKRTYDAAGNLLSVTDPDNNTTSYTYDALNRMSSQTNAINTMQTYHYDAVGNLVSLTDFDGRTIDYTYDARNLLISEQWLDSANNPIYTITSSYDPAGELTATSDPDASYVYTYYVTGRLQSSDNLGTPGAPEVVIKYAYDPAGNLLAVTDSFGGATIVDTTYAYDALNRAVNINDVTQSYDADGELTKTARYTDSTLKTLVSATTYSYDVGGRLTGQTDTAGTATVANYKWTYNAAGLITQQVSPSGTTTYTYDATNQLKSAVNTSVPNESYSYDANGNRTNTGYRTGPGNRLLSDGTYNYTYDANGNLLMQTTIATGAQIDFTWDYRNRLTQVVYKNAAGTITKQVDYTYDMLNRRISETIHPTGPASTPTSTQFVYSGNQVALEFAGAGNLLEHFVYAPAGRLLSATDAAGHVLWVLSDNLDSVRFLLNSTDAVADRLTYSSFGKITAQTSPSIGFLFAYAGYQYDPATGLYYDMARYYSPTLGRFISQDPLSFQAGDADLYRYVGNEPIGAVDPSGLQEWDPSGSQNNPWANLAQAASNAFSNIGQSVLNTVLNLFTPPAEASETTCTQPGVASYPGITPLNYSTPVPAASVPSQEAASAPQASVYPDSSIPNPPVDAFLPSGGSSQDTGPALNGPSATVFGLPLAKGGNSVEAGSLFSGTLFSASYSWGSPQFTVNMNVLKFISVSIGPSSVGLSTGYGISSPVTVTIPAPPSNLSPQQTTKILQSLGVGGAKSNYFP